MIRGNRRAFLQACSLAAGASLAGGVRLLAAKGPEAPGAEGFRFRYILASCMYGELPLEVILPEVAKTGARVIDIWPRRHGNQREQMEAMGHDRFEALLEQHGVRLGCLTHYDLGPFALADEMPVARRFGCDLMICGAKGPKGLTGGELKTAVREFCRQMEPHLDRASEFGVRIAIENHGNSLIDSPDSLKWLLEYRPGPNLKVALAPYHLQAEGRGLDARGLGQLIRDLGHDIAMFYAWQYGMGCHKKLPKEQELLQMPGRGDLDFAPAVDALKQIGYQGYTAIFMHPVPRGIPILPTAEATTAEINRSRDYLESVIS